LSGEGSGFDSQFLHVYSPLGEPIFCSFACLGPRCALGLLAIPFDKCGCLEAEG
jgi:hypothetical protein